MTLKVGLVPKVLRHTKTLINDVTKNIIFTVSKNTIQFKKAGYHKIVWYVAVIIGH